MTSSSSESPPQPSSVHSNAAVSRTRDGPATPSGSQREHGSGHATPSTTSRYASPAKVPAQHSPSRSSSVSSSERTSTDSARGAHTQTSAVPSPRGTAPNRRIRSYSGTSQTAPSGGSVRVAENGCSCHGTASASTPPRLPTPLPP